MPKGYIATDVISRMKRMQGHSVLHPMGFDAFGLPAENYALKTKTNPEVAVKKNIARYKKQLELLGFDYDWSREVNTTDPDYYRWTQWIFLQLFKKGLAYESYEPVNWCPTDKTVLANEDVENGRCERCGTLVEKKSLRQWVLRITDYADRLLKDLDATTGIPLVTRAKGEDGVRKGLAFSERWPVVCLIKHWSEEKYLCVKWKASGWQGFIIGGIEKGEDAATAGSREISEETGFKNVRFVREVGKVDAKFYQMVKKVNRHAHFTGAYFELADSEQDPIAENEKQLQDIVWLSKDEVHDFTTHADMTYIWDLFTGAEKQEIKPLLDWPESIKEAQRNWIGRSEGAEIEFRLTITKNKLRFIILHGFEGSAQMNFIPWLKSELEKQGHEVEAPELPNPNHPKEPEQVDYVIKNCRFDENTVLIGHSLGATVAMKVLMKLDKPISDLVIVAGAVDPKFDKHYDSRPFSDDFSWDFDYSRVRELTGGKITVLSDLTEKFRVPYLRYLAKQLSARLVETTAVEEHFCAEQEPEILETVIPKIKVFTTRPDTLFGMTYVVLAPEHKLVKELLGLVSNRAEVEAYVSKSALETEIQRTDAGREKTGVKLGGITAVNPANEEEVPVWVADYVLADYGTGAVMAVPAHDERDREFAEKFALPIRDIVLENKEEMIKKFGKKITKYKLRDWVFSRQRYWGEPIPVIHCGKCAVVAVPEKDLPVKLPKVKSYEPTGTGESPLAAIFKWVNVKCPQCKGPAKRETNTMPQWAGSCWYYLRYEDPKNKKVLVDPKKEKYWSPVDIYVGGAEHATRHLIYARFWHKFLYDIGAVSAIEPFIKLRSVGLIMGEDGRKMSKRFGNVISPDDIVKAFGADTLRIYEMFMGPFDQSIAWSTESMAGPRRFIERVWKLKEKIGKEKIENHNAVAVIQKTIKKVTDDIGVFRFNTAISSLMIAVNELEKVPSVSREQYESLLKLLAPFAPHVTEELWAMLGNKKSIHISDWPKLDGKLVSDSEVTIAVQVNGKYRGSFRIEQGTSKEVLEARAKALPEATKWLERKDIRKTIVVPDRLVNIVL